MGKAKKQKLGPNQEKWLKALEGQKFKQGKEVLQLGEKCCCIGVACLVLGPKPVGETTSGIVKFGTNGDTQHAPKSLVKKLGLYDNIGTLAGPRLGDSRSLVGANDDGRTFKTIAAFCRKHPESVFREPR